MRGPAGPRGGDAYAGRGQLRDAPPHRGGGGEEAVPGRGARDEIRDIFVPACTSLRLAPQFFKQRITLIN